MTREGLSALGNQELLPCIAFMVTVHIGFFFIWLLCRFLEPLSGTKSHRRIDSHNGYNFHGSRKDSSLVLPGEMNRTW